MLNSNKEIACRNWIGGSDFNRCSADYVPPPHEFVAALVEDLCAFCNTDDLPLALPPVSLVLATHARDYFGGLTASRYIGLPSPSEASAGVKPANDAIQRLVEADILRQITIGRRNRAYEALEIIEAFTDLERQLASPVGNTLTSPPARAAPRRRQKQA